MGDWIAGGDVCQEVCPFNGEEAGPRARGQGPRDEKVTNDTAFSRRACSPTEQAEPTDESGNESMSHADKLKQLPSPDEAYAPRLPALPLLEVLNWTEADRRAAVVRSALKRIKLEQFKRNALIAAGNHLRSHDDASLLDCLRQIVDDSSEHALVRQTAQQTLDRLSNR